MNEAEKHDHSTQIGTQSQKGKSNVNWMSPICNLENGHLPWCILRCLQVCGVHSALREGFVHFRENNERGTT